MRIRKLLPLLLIAVFALGLALVATSAQAAPPVQTASVSLTVLNPQGAIPLVTKFSQRLSTLDGKKVALWLMMPNTFEYQPAGKAFYDKLGQMLTKQFPTIQLITPDKLDNASDAAKASASIIAAKPDAAVLGMGG